MHWAYCPASDLRRNVELAEAVAPTTPRLIATEIIGDIENQSKPLRTSSGIAQCSVTGVPVKLIA